ncbi:MAG: hypothetical protein KF716_25285 [Anaerolineae bacterium]|nr:hypothetical protein [Anaerolineae bacterium]
MGIAVEWTMSEANVIAMTVEGKWTWDDLSGAMNAAHDMMDATSYDAIDFLLDMRHCDILPSNILSRMKHVSQHHHPKSRDMVVVGAGRFADTLFNLMERIMPQRMQHIKLVQTLDEAHQYFRQTQAMRV